MSAPKQQSMRILLGVLRRIDYAGQMQRLVAPVRGFCLPHVKDTDVYGVEEGDGRDSGLPVVAGLSPTAAGPNDGSYERRWRARAATVAAASALGESQRAIREMHKIFRGGRAP